MAIYNREGLVNLNEKSILINISDFKDILLESKYTNR